MLFNSYEFILVFLPIAFVGYYFFNSIKKYTIAKTYLLIMSLYFYSYFNKKYLIIILLSILFNYIVSAIFSNVNWKEHTYSKKILLIIAILCNLGSIFYFKYYDFFILNINSILNTNFSLLHLVLPLGISFFTFQQISFIVDSYKEEINYNFIDYALFVTFFPQLIAGPIVTHKEIMPQFSSLENKRINYDNLSRGLTAFTFGLSKKVIIADFCGNIVNLGFDNLSALNMPSAILVVFSYTMQIYFDFSGYCDMATGIGYMFNIIMPINFNSPYKALTILDFWKRWHMTLTRFLTWYIYIPLGGNRKGVIRTCINVLIVYLVSGLWHGANWTFIFWGTLHGVACVVERLFKKKISNLHPALSWIITFTFINLTWIYFRSPSIGEANQLLKNIFSLDLGPINEKLIALYNLSSIQIINKFLIPYLGVCITPLMFAIVFNIVLLISVLGFKNTNEKIIIFKPNIRTAIMIITLNIMSIISFSNVSTFLYFNF